MDRESNITNYILALDRARNSLFLPCSVINLRLLSFLFLKYSHHHILFMVHCCSARRPNGETIVKSFSPPLGLLRAPSCAVDCLNPRKDVLVKHVKMGVHTYTLLLCLFVFHQITMVVHTYL